MRNDVLPVMADAHSDPLSSPGVTGFGSGRGSNATNENDGEWKKFYKVEYSL